MKWPNNPLMIDPGGTIEEIIQLIRVYHASLNRKVAVLGLSGGLDSSIAATLTANALGPENVRLYYLPERDSKPIHGVHAHLVSEWLQADLTVKRITPVIRALRVYSLLPLSIFPGRRLKAMAVDFGRNKFLKHSAGEFLTSRLNNTGGDWVSRGNAYACAKHRVRGVILYKEAERFNGMVVGAANRTEWLTGTFTQWGCDHTADVMPLLHLYRSQLEELAEYLDLPEVVRSKPADPDILPGLEDKGDLLGSFQEADQILWGLENGISKEELNQRFGKDKVTYLRKLKNNSSYYRESPYSLL